MMVYPLNQNLIYTKQIPFILLKLYKTVQNIRFLFMCNVLLV